MNGEKKPDEILEAAAYDYHESGHTRFTLGAHEHLPEPPDKLETRQIAALARALEAAAEEGARRALEQIREHLVSAWHDGASSENTTLPQWLGMVPPEYEAWVEGRHTPALKRAVERMRADAEPLATREEILAMARYIFGRLEDFTDHIEERAALEAARSALARAG